MRHSGVGTAAPHLCRHSAATFRGRVVNVGHQSITLAAGRLGKPRESCTHRRCVSHQVQDGEEVGRALDSGDQVELSVVINRKLGTTVAEALKLLCKAEDKRELGQVSSCQDNLLCALKLL